MPRLPDGAAGAAGSAAGTVVPGHHGGGRGRRSIAWLLALVVSIALTVTSLYRWEAVRDRQQGLLSVPPVRLVRLLACGYDNMLADAFYMQFTTYWGYWLTHGRKFHNLHLLLDLVVELDPAFKTAYEVGALALADAGDLDRAVDLLLEGAHHHPRDYWYPYQAGLMLFLYGTDYVLAAKYFEMAARIPGAPADSEFFAARMYAHGGQRELARTRWLQIYMQAARTHDRSRQEVAARSLGRYEIGPTELDVIALYVESTDPKTREDAVRVLQMRGIDILAIDPDR